MCILFIVFSGVHKPQDPWSDGWAAHHKEQMGEVRHKVSFTCNIFMAFTLYCLCLCLGFGPCLFCLFFCMCLSLCQMAENTAKKVMHGFNTLLCQGLLEVPIITVMVKIYLKGTPWQKLDYAAKKSAVV